MDQIPIEVLKIIFEFLPASQLNDCMRVCKKWKLTIDCLVELDCLVVYQGALPVNQRFFHTNQQVDLQHCIHVDNFLGESREFKKGIYRKFKRLYVYDYFENFRLASDHYPKLGSCWMFSEFFKLNLLNQLEELHLWMVTLEEDCRLVLPRLKTFKKLSIFNHTLTLDTPQLTTLSVFNFEHLRLMHPQTIQILQFTGRTLFTDNEHECLFTLCGLKCLLLQNFQKFFIEQKPRIIAFFRSLRDLKEIHVESSALYNLYNLFDLFKLSSYRDFYEMMKRLKLEAGDRIRISFAGLEMACLFNLPDYVSEVGNQFGISERNRLDFYLANRSMTLETLPFYYVNYSLVENAVGDDLDLFAPRRLPQLFCVLVSTEVRDERALGRWLKGQNTVSDLCFRGPLSQEFYSSILPASCPKVEILHFRFMEQIDFSFLTSLKFLYIAICRPFDHHLTKLLFTNLIYFKKLCFLKEDLYAFHKCLEVSKERNTFKVEESSKEKVFVSLEELTKYLDAWLTAGGYRGSRC